MTILGKNFRLGEVVRSEDARPLLGDTQGESSENDRLSDTSPSPAANSRDSSSINMSQTTGNANSGKQSDFMFIKIVARITLQVVRKFWAFSSAAILAIILFYWLCGGVIAFCLVMFAFTGLLYNATDRLLFHPDQPPTSRVYVPSPATFGLAFENLYIRSKDSTRIHMFFVKCHGSVHGTVKYPTILFLHGNAGNVGHRLANVQGLVKKLCCNVCLLEYRGFGHSDGTPSEEGLYLDAQAAFDYLWTRPDIDPTKIFVFGRSLGGAVAVDLCSRPEYKDRVACMILENTFTSIPDIGKVMFNFRVLRWIPTWFYKNQFFSKTKILKVTTSVLFISGLMDGLIPPSMMNDLFRNCGSEKKRMARFTDGSHNETWLCNMYYQTIAYFLEEMVFNSLPTEVKVNPPPMIVNMNDHNVI